MALKIWKDGAMSKIDTNLHKPVIFINGTKYKLDKAYTFINGVKKELWGASGVQVDYISSTGTLGGGNLFAIGENWANVSYLNNILRLDISNLSSPSLIQSVNWGNVVDFNGYKSLQGNMIFDATQKNYSAPSLTVNVISVNSTTGEITVNSNNVESSSNNFLARTDNYLITESSRKKTFPTTHSTTSITYGTNFYWNNTLKYSTGREPSSATDTSGNLILSGTKIQIGEDTILFNLSGNYGTGTGLYTGTSSSYSKINSFVMTGDLLYDDDYVVRAYRNVGVASFYDTTRTAISLYDKTSYSILYTYQVNYVDDGIRLKFLGRINDYYYVLTLPADTNATSDVNLVLLDKDDLSVVLTKELPADPFNENDGKITFWANASIIPHISQSGFLGVGTYNSSTLGLRIARFSDLI